jgi:iron complex outermembrane receptor protein
MTASARPTACPERHRPDPVKFWPVLLALLACAPATAFAQSEPAPDLQSLSLDQLANVEVTGVSRRAEPLSRAPAAAYVITAEEIRRSGAGNLPEVLRLAPNLEVARMNGYAYTITARGFNSPESANKLLVLIDGRSVYSPLASTVFWENIDVPLADIARIEVVSGPGGTLYGANAVNGVINIITKNAADTQGGLLDARVGQTGGYKGMLRYGFAPWEGGAVRLYGQLGRNGGTEPFLSTDKTLTGFARSDGGFRFDQVLGAETFNLSGDIYANHTSQQAIEIARGEDLNGHWTHAFDSGSTLGAELVYDESVRTLPGTPQQREQLQTYDMQIQHNTSLGWGDSFIWGGEYRQSKETYDSQGFFFLDPTTTISIGSAFAQDEIPLAPDLKLTAGLKLEDNSYSGLDPMPNVRLAWQVTESDMIWAAASGAVRTPSKIDRELEAPGILLPSPNFGSEKLTTYELGYRGEPLPRLALSASLFYNVYDDLRSDQGTPVTVVPIILLNGVKGESYGIDLWAKYGLTDWWRLTGGVSWLNRDFRSKPGFLDFAQGQSEGQDPATMAQIRSNINLLQDFEFDSALRGVGKVTQQSPNSPFPQFSLVPGYIEADLRLGWHVTEKTELAFSVLNLLHDRHLEANDPSTYAPQYVPRSFVLNLRQSF